MLYFKKVLYTALIAASFGLTGCGDDEENNNSWGYEYPSGGESSTSSFSVVPGRFDLDSSPQTVTAYLQNASSLYIECTQLSWAKAERHNDEIRITVSANTGGARNGFIHLTSGSSSQAIDINQQGGYTGGGNNNPGEGNNNPGEGDNNPGGSSSAPSAPSYIYASPDGPSSAPFAAVSWASVSNATSYQVYRSTSAMGSYSLIKTVATNAYHDETVKYGSTYYYKVKAKNSVGTSAFSDYAECSFTDRRKPGPVIYGNCTVSGTTMTLRWRVPTDASYGKPTKAILRVMNPMSGKYADVETLSGTATSASFAYGMWIDNDGYVRAGIILENENGTGGGTPKIYDTKNKKWIN